VLFSRFRDSVPSPVNFRVLLSGVVWGKGYLASLVQLSAFSVARPEAQPPESVEEGPAPEGCRRRRRRPVALRCDRRLAGPPPMAPGTTAASCVGFGRFRFGFEERNELQDVKKV